MKILFVLECANQYNNGTAATCLRSARELEKLGHEVTLIGCEGENLPYSRYVPLKMFHFPIFQRLIISEGFNFVKMDHVSMYKAISECDVVHIFLPFKLGNECRLIAESLNKPVTVAFHLLPQNITSAIHMGWAHFVNNVIFKSFRTYFYEYVYLCHCPTTMTSFEMKKHGYKNDCRIISNGVNLDFFHPMKVDKPEALRDKFIVVSVGRLAKEKRQDLLINAVARTANKDKIHLILCGQGPEKKKYIKLAQKLGVDMEVKFCKQEELREILAYGDLYVHCADFEIEGISCIEAFAMGLVPLIGDAKLSATRFFSISEVCSFRHGNKKMLAKKIDWFVTHPKEREALSKRYIELAQDYALPREAKKMERMFEDAIENKKVAADYFSMFGFRKKDKRKLRRIYKELIKKGVVSSMPEVIKQKAPR